jgi:hypothetical protein
LLVLIDVAVPDVCKDGVNQMLLTVGVPQLEPAMRFEPPAHTNKYTTTSALAVMLALLLMPRNI